MGSRVRRYSDHCHPLFLARSRRALLALYRFGYLEHYDIDLVALDGAFRELSRVINERNNELVGNEVKLKASIDQLTRLLKEVDALRTELLNRNRLPAVESRVAPDATGSN